MAGPGLQPQLDQQAYARKKLESSLHAIFRGKQLDIDNCLPAIVISYDRVNNIATVKPLIMKVATDDSTISRQPIANVPVLALGGGGFFINFPLVAGDLGWIHANDRDINLFKQALAEVAPPGGPLHSFDNAMLIPDVFRKYTINGADSAAMVISTTDGATRISIRPGEIDLTAPTKVKIDTPLAEFTHDVQIDGNLTVTGNATITGQTAVNGGFSATGSGGSGSYVTLPANTTINGVTVATHGHTQNGTSGRTSGGMLS